MRERAVLPSIDLYKETLSGILQVPVKKLTGRGVFGMVPVDVLAMKNIKPSAKLLLAAMGVDAAGRCFVSASDEVLARIAGMSRPTMIAARAELERAEAIIETIDDSCGNERMDMAREYFSSKARKD